MHHRTRTTLAVILLAALSAVALTACATGAGRNASYTFEFSTLRAQLSYPLDAVHRAAEGAINDFGLEIESSDKDAFESRIIARGVRNLRHSISINRVGDNAARVAISVGALGDEPRSREIMSRIEERLAGRVTGSVSSALDAFTRAGRSATD